MAAICPRSNNNFISFLANIHGFMMSTMIFRHALPSDVARNLGHSIVGEIPRWSLFVRGCRRSVDILPKKEKIMFYHRKQVIFRHPIENREASIFVFEFGYIIVRLEQGFLFSIQN